MSRKYEKLTTDIIELLGGSENIIKVYHCVTRLRFTLKDDSNIDDEKVQNLEGVAQVVRNGGVYQIIIGTHVEDVYNELIKHLSKNEEEQNEKSSKNGIFSTVIDFVSSVFQPIIPALSGAGMVKAVLALLVVFNVITTDSQTYYLLNIFSDGVFYFLPILLAYTTAKKMGSSPILAISVAAMMLHPNWTSMVTAGEPVHFFEVIPFTLTSYASQVIPIILIIIVQSYVEKVLKRIIPKSIELIFLPMLTFIIMGVLAFSILGPLGAIVGDYLGAVFYFLSDTVPWAPAVLIGGFLPIMVMFGLHNGIGPIGVMQMSDVGYDSIWGPGCLCSNMAQATANAVVAWRTSNKEERVLATSSSITAFMGITEPGLYGIALPKKYPLIASMIGGASGGLYAGITQTHRFATGSSGLPAVLLYIGDDTLVYFKNIMIALIIAIIVSGIVTFILSLKYEK